MGLHTYILVYRYTTVRTIFQEADERGTFLPVLRAETALRSDYTFIQYIRSR